ncbi:hypothetical protein, partial [Methanosarcina mazei]|uniref:hypothetical protein n=1 Tax=Methanosarcina mazei TaxID=2209 RepID=UPI002E153391
VRGCLIICPRVTGRAARSIPHPLGWGGRPQFDFAAFFYSQELSQFPVGFNDILRLCFYGHRLSGHNFQKKGYGTVSPTADPEAGGNFKAFQFFKEISFQNDTSR